MQWKRKNGLDGVTQQSKNKGTRETWDTSSGATVEGKTDYFFLKKAERKKADPNSRINTVIESSNTSINQRLHQTFHSNSNWTVVNHIEDVNPSLGQAAHTLKRSTKQFEWICPTICCVARRKKMPCNTTKQFFVLLLIVFAECLSHVGKEEGEDVSMRS